MTMKAIRVGIFIAVACVFLCPAWSSATDIYDIDPVHSSIIFRVKHLDITFVYGRFNNAVGVVAFEEENIEEAFIEVSVRVADIDTGNAKRDAHLRSADFFDAASFPNITFRSLSVKKTGDDRYEVTGDLSLHGVTRTVTVEAVKTGERRDLGTARRIGFQADFSVKRSDYDMQYMLGGVADTIELMVSVEGILRERDL